MNIFTFPLRYLSFRDEKNRLLFMRDAPAALILALLVSFPFWVTDANFFGQGGFLDRFGSFAGVLTGFYVAALVAVASFAGRQESLDEVIEVGPIIDPFAPPESNKLTRRQYVCYMFGYLAFVALALSLVGIILVVISAVVANVMRVALPADVVGFVGGVTTLVVTFVVSHMVATTCHGLYYLIDRLYVTKATMLDKDGNEVEAASVGK